MTEAEFKTQWSLLCVAYRQDSNVSTMKLYWQYFKSFDDNDFKRCIQSTIATSEFFPSVATLMTALEHITNIVPTEADVILDYMNTMHRYGTVHMNKSPEFKYPVTHALAEELGWFESGRMKEEELKKSIHFRYPMVIEHYRKCIYSGTDFPLNRIKGRFSESKTYLGSAKPQPIRKLLEDKIKGE